MKPLPATVFREVAKPDRIALVTQIMVILALVCAFLYYGKSVLIPVALAILFTFLLTPAVKKLQKLGAPKTLAITMVAVVVFSMLAAFGYLVSQQVAGLTAELPKYETNLREKVKSLKSLSSRDGLLGGAGDMLGRLGAELDSEEPAKGGQISQTPPREVTVLNSNPGLIETFGQILGPILSPAIETVLVSIFCIFFLFQREDLRDRVIRLAGRGDILKTTAAMDDAASKLSKLFVMQALVNGGFGLFIGVALWMMGIPAAALWGLFAGLMRFVPYIGAVIAAVFPVALAAAVSPDWTLPLMVAALFLITEPIVGHAIEPVVFGHTAGLSPVAVITAAAFWTAVWGPVGLLLATPLTICMTVLGRHVEGLGFLDVMFGSQPALNPAQSFYQRLLTRDRHDAASLAEAQLVEMPMSEFLRTVAAPSLLLADADRFQRRLSHLDQTELAIEFSSVLETVFVADDDHEGRRDDDTVLIVPAPGQINFAATVALSASLSAVGISHRMMDESAASPLSAADHDSDKTKLIVLSYLTEPPAGRVEFVQRRLKGKFGETPLIVASWFATSEEGTEARPHAGVRDFILSRIGATGNVTHSTPGNFKAMEATSA
jgi:predicted PurR-regulated permease PerM